MTNQTFSIVYQQFFVRGNLKGITYGPTILSFPTSESRLKWLQGVRANQSNGSLDYVFTGDIMFYTNMTDEDCLEDYKTWAHA